MVDIIKQFNPGIQQEAYGYGEVTSVGFNGAIGVRTTAGLNLSIMDPNVSYTIGDQVVLGLRGTDLNSLFIIRKIRRVCASAVNIVIQEGQG